MRVYVAPVYTGRKAEAVAADYLQRAGFAIIDRNWRRRECEIDIVASKASTIHLVEVKYRQNDDAGSGLEYVTAAKLRRMAYAAQRWVTANNWHGPFTLAAIEVTGDDFSVSAFVESIDL